MSTEIDQLVEARADHTVRADSAQWCHCARCLRHVAYSAYMSAAKAWCLPVDHELRQAAEAFADRIAA